MRRASTRVAKRSAGPELWAQASHDLRQPVQAMLLLVHALSAQEDEHARQQIVARMEDSLASLREMLEALTMLARFETGQRAPEISLCAIGEATMAAVDALRDRAAERGSALSATPFRAVARSDARLLPTLLRSLLIAAIASSEGGGIVVTGRTRSGKIRIGVEYRGPDVSPAQLNTAFFEVRSVRDPSASAERGLGLGFLERLCRALGHRLEISRTREGCQTFTLVLDARRPARPKLPTA